LPLVRIQSSPAVSLSLTILGSKCGSISVDLAFKKWLREVLGERDYQKLDPSQLNSKIGSHSVEGRQMRELMHGFDKQKRKFNRSHRDIKMDLPSPLHNLNKDNMVVDGEITITKSVITFYSFTPN
jgi:hypothetical protein